MAQITELSATATPGQVHSFSAKAQAAGALFNLMAGQTYLDGITAGQTRVDGIIAGETYLDGAVAGQTEPS